MWSRAAPDSRGADIVLVGVNLIYATSYVATRLTLGDVPPAALALLRCVIGAACLLPLARNESRPIASADRWRIVAMGSLGFGAAFAFAHWGLLESTAANAALLIIVEPVTIIALSPLLLGETLHRREVVGAALAILGAVLVVLNGIPGVTERLAPRWRGDLLLILSGVSFASYSLLGREVLRRHAATRVTRLSILYGAVTLVPFAGMEWWVGARPVWTGQALLGTAYLAIVITGLAYLVWNWALERVPAPRAAIFLNLQPIGGALLGVMLLHDPFTVFTAVGGALIVGGLWMTVRRHHPKGDC